MKLNWFREDEDLNGFQWTTDNQKVAEMEFYLVDDLECDLVIFHPYRTLLALCKKEANTSPEDSEEGEALDLGAGLDTSDSLRYWGTGEGQLELPPGALQVAWFVISFPEIICYQRIHRSIINDTYRSQLCLLHPPHLIAIAAIYLTFIIHPPVRPEPQISDDLESSHRQPRRSSRQASNHSNQKKTQTQDPITFLAELNVSLPVVASISQEIISLYALWDQYKEDVTPDAAKLARELTGSPPAAGGTVSRTRQHKASSSRSNSQGYISHYHSYTQSSAGTPVTDTNETLDTTSSVQENKSGNDGKYVTPAFLSLLMMKMREMKIVDMATTPPSSAVRTTGTVSGKRAAVNKRLERAQVGG